MSTRTQIIPLGAPHICELPYTSAVEAGQYYGCHQCGRVYTFDPPTRCWRQVTLRPKALHLEGQQ